MFKSNKHKGNIEEKQHYLKENGGVSFLDFCWFYLFPRVIKKTGCMDIFWLCYGWTPYKTI